MWRLAQVQKPPVPQLGSSKGSPGLGSVRPTIKAVSARRAQHPAQRRDSPWSD